MKIIASLEDNQATLKSVFESGAIKVSESIQSIKIDRTKTDICVAHSDDPEKITRPILTITGIGGE